MESTNWKITSVFLSKPTVVPLWVCPPKVSEGLNLAKKKAGYKPDIRLMHAIAAKSQRP